MPNWLKRIISRGPDVFRLRYLPYYFVLALTDEAGNEAVADNNGQNYSFATEP